MDYESQIERLYELWEAMDLDTVTQLDEATLAAKAEFEGMDEIEITGIFYEYVDNLWNLEDDKDDFFEFYDED